MEIQGTKIVAAMWSAIMDDVTCDLCIFYDGMSWDIHDGSIPTPVDDTHEDCRCLLAYIGEDEIDIDWLPVAKTPPKSLLKEFGGISVLAGLAVLPKFKKTPEGRDIFDVDIEEV